MRLFQLRNPALVSRQEHPRQAEQRQREEPPGSPKRRHHDDEERRRRLVPEAFSAGRNDQKAILARRQMGIVGYTSRPGLNPVLIESAQPVLEAELLGAAETQSGVVNLQALLAGCDAHGLTERQRLPVK